MKKQNGFILPVVLLVSITMIAIGLSLIQATSSIRVSLTNLYVNKLATEASDSGLVYANYCYNKYGLQTWNEAAGKPLTPQTDCYGNVNSSYPTYIQSFNNYRSTFSVGDIESAANTAKIVSAAGKVDTLALNASTPYALSTYSFSQKQLLDGQQMKASLSASGTYKTCAIIGGKLYCWGENNTAQVGEPINGQLGDGTTNRSYTPVAVVAETNVLANKVVTKVVSAQFHNCALAEGEVYCWGNNDSGQLGNGGSSGYSSKPVKVTGFPAGSTVSDIGATGNSSCAIIQPGGKIYCWGGNSDGTVGANSTQAEFTQPTPVSSAKGLPSDYTATKLATSGSRSYNMCAIADGLAYCWGDNERGQIGNGTSGATNILAPTPVDTSGQLKDKTVTAISQDGVYNGNPVYTHVCAIANDGDTSSVYCWGDNSSYGALGNGSKTSSSVPVKVSNNSSFTNDNISGLVVGLHHTCALRQGAAYCWGDGTAGQLGDGTFTTKTKPVPIYTGGDLSGQTITALGGGANRACAIANFVTYCWGLNTNGQLGDGTQTNRNVPTRSSFLDPKANGFLF